MIHFITDFPGTGKSRRKARDMAERAIRGEMFLYVASSHDVLLEMEDMVLAELKSLGHPPEVVDDEGRIHPRVAHKWSRLEEVRRPNGETIPPCAKRGLLKVLADEIGGVKLGKHCRTACEYRENCGAKKFAEENDRALKNANIVLVSEAAFAGMRDDLGGRQLVIDDVTTYVDVVNISGERMAAVRSDRALWGVSFNEREAAREIACAWREGREPGDIEIDTRQVSIAEWLAERNDFDVIGDPGKAEHMDAEYRAQARAVRDVLRLAAGGWKPPKGPTAEVCGAWLKSTLIVAAEARDAEWLDATPWTKVLDHLGVDYETRSEHGYPAGQAYSWRTWVKCGKDGRTKSGMGPLTKTYWNGSRLDEKIKRPNSGEVGIDWPRVFNAMHEARAVNSEGWALFTYKSIVDVLLETHENGRRVAVDAVEGGELAALSAQERKRLEALHECRRLLGADGKRHLGYFHNLRSRNDWQDVESVYVLGTPWMAAGEILETIGFKKNSDAYWAAFRQYAQNEITQAVERCRSARRGYEHPVMITVEADLPGAGGEWAPTSPRTGLARFMDLSPSQTHHVTEADTKAILARTVEDILCVHGEEFASELAATMEITPKALQKYRADGAVPVTHACVLAQRAPESIELADAYERDTAEGGDPPLPTQDELRDVLSRLDDVMERPQLAHELGVHRTTVSKLLLRRKPISDVVAKKIIALAAVRGSKAVDSTS